jgi:hypothetical protein
MRTLLLTAHITGVAAWLGANLTQLFLVRFYARQHDEGRLAWLRATTLMARQYYNVAGTLIGVTGALLVIHGTWGWDSGFIWVGVAVLVIGGVIGALHFVPTGAKQVAAIEAGDRELLGRLDRRVTAVALFDTALVIVAMLAMVDKWGR